MKQFLVFTLIAASFQVFAVSMHDFHATIRSDTKKDLEKDDLKYKKDIHRAPASVETQEDICPHTEELKRAEKLKGLGNKKW